MKVIFLDNDGVICLESEWGSRFKKGTDFDRLNTKAVKVLNDIIEQTGAEIVISSDWKLHANLEALNKHYADHGVMKAAIAVTPRYEVKKMSESYDLESNRIKEIQMYLKDHPEVTEWVAVDDLEMFDLGEDHFVHCSHSRQGIKECGIKEKILRILGKL